MWTTLVLCDESGYIKFPFSYLAHVTLLAPVQARFRISSGSAQDLFTLRTVRKKGFRGLGNLVCGADWMPGTARAPVNLRHYYDEVRIL